MPNAAEVERFIIEDNQGEFYLITRAMLEQAKVTGKDKEEVAKLVHHEADEIQGYNMAIQTVPFFNSQLIFRGACACSMAGCQTFNKADWVMARP
jgi:hypothetical protein